LSVRGIEAHVIHISSVTVSRGDRRAKTDRLDAELLKRAFLGWRRGEREILQNPSRRRTCSCTKPYRAICATDVLSRVTRGLTGSPDESGSNAARRNWPEPVTFGVRRGMIQLAGRFLMLQKDSALARWFRARTDNVPGSRKKMIVALARKLLIAL
jgi:hypothetical protein